MLVAEKRQFAEDYYPRAHALDKEQPISLPKSRVAPKTKRRSGKKVFHLALVLMGFAICSYTVARFAMICQKQQEILELEKILQREQNLQGYMRLELASRGNLQTIEEFAKNNLDMDYPDGEQVFYVELPEKTIEEFAVDSTIESEQEESLWSKIVSLLD